MSELFLNIETRFSELFLVSILAGLASAFPAAAIMLGFAFILLGLSNGIAELVQGGWGFITVGVIVEFVLPISRRLR
jgi:hypothetical protein